MLESTHIAQTTAIVCFQQFKTFWYPDLSENLSDLLLLDGLYPHNKFYEDLFITFGDILNTDTPKHYLHGRGNYDIKRHLAV